MTTRGRQLGRRQPTTITNTKETPGTTTASPATTPVTNTIINHNQSITSNITTTSEISRVSLQHHNIIGNKQSIPLPLQNNPHQFRTITHHSRMTKHHFMTSDSPQDTAQRFHDPSWLYIISEQPRTLPNTLSHFGTYLSILPHQPPHQEQWREILIHVAALLLTGMEGY